MDAYGDVLYNLYGSTEVGIGALATPAELRRSAETVGKPVIGCPVRIFDRNGRPVGPRVTGRIFVGGELMSDGYIGSPVGEQAKVVIDRMTSTGDMGYLDESGRLYNRWPRGRHDRFRRRRTSIRARWKMLWPNTPASPRPRSSVRRTSSSASDCRSPSSRPQAHSPARCPCSSPVSTHRKISVSGVIISAYFMHSRAPCVAMSAMPSRSRPNTTRALQYRRRVVEVDDRALGAVGSTRTCARSASRDTAPAPGS